MVRYLGVPGGQRAAYARRIVERMVDEAYWPELFDGVDAVVRALAQEGTSRDPVGLAGGRH
jgi:hypothetical protein